MSKLLVTAVQYFVTAESRFPTLAELVHHHSIHSDGLITQVRAALRRRILVPPPSWSTTTAFIQAGSASR